jgi:hypothetical protein
MKIIGEHDHFILMEVKQGKVWQGLKLINTSRRKKCNWWFAWDGQRLSETKDAKLLREHEPEIYTWIVKHLRTTASRGAVERRVRR